jgi:UDP-N-acetylmuramoylalanine--D-glutamate ligase
VPREEMPGSIELRKMRVLVIGLARTGVATALFCAKHNATVTATDARPESGLGDVPSKLREAGVTLELGAHHEKTYLAQDLIIPSPGVPADHELLVKARSKKITVWSEIELAYRFLEGEMIGITGSNGKTTTTTLVHHIL